MGQTRPNGFALAKLSVLFAGLLALVVITGLNVHGQLSLNVGAMGYALLMLLATVLFVLSVRASLQALAGFTLSAWMTRAKKPVPFRALLFHASAWGDHDSWAELGPWVIAALILSVAPMLLAAFSAYGFHSYEVYGAETELMWDSAGIAGSDPDLNTLKLMSSSRLLPNQTEWMLAGNAPSYFCVERVPSDSAPAPPSQPSFVLETTLSATVHVPAWPFAKAEYMGDRGQRITVRNTQGYTFNISCWNTYLPGKTKWGANVTAHGLDSGLDTSKLVSAQVLEPSKASLYFYLRHKNANTNFDGEMTCEARIMRANVSSTWTVNSTGFHVEGCFDVSVMDFRDKFKVNLEDVDTWLNLTYRHTYRGPVRVAQEKTGSRSEQDEVRGIASIVHVVTWLYGYSRDNDPAHGPSVDHSQAKASKYTYVPIYSYNETSDIVFIMLLVALLALAVAMTLRFIPHGFHGGSVAQLVHMGRGLALSPWSQDPLHIRNKQGSTNFAVLIQDHDELVPAVNAHEQVEDPSVLGEGDYSTSGCTSLSMVSH